MSRHAVDELIEYRTSTGDYYPSFVELLKSKGEKSLGEQSVNVAAGVAATKGGWIGLNLFLMAPDEGSAREIIPAFAALLVSYGFKGTAAGVIKMLNEALEEANPQTEDAEVWPKEAPPLLRSGVRAVPQ